MKNIDGPTKCASNQSLEESSTSIGPITEATMNIKGGVLIWCSKLDILVVAWEMIQIRVDSEPDKWHSKQNWEVGRLVKRSQQTAAVQSQLCWIRKRDTHCRLTKMSSVELEELALANSDGEKRKKIVAMCIFTPVSQVCFHHKIAWKGSDFSTNQYFNKTCGRVFSTNQHYG